MRLFSKTPRSLLQKVGRNLAAFSYGQGTILLLQLVQVPLFLHFWGVEKYGEWIVLSGIPLMLAIADFGIAQASASKASVEAGKQDWTAARDTLKAAQVYCLAIGGFLVVGAAVSCFVLDWSATLKLSHVDRFTASFVLVALTAALACRLQAGFLDAWMRASGHAALSGFVSASTPLVQTIVAGLMLLGGAGFVALSLGFLCVSVALQIAHAIAAKEKAGLELTYMGQFRVTELKKIIKPAAGFLGVSLTQALTIQGGIQILNQLASAQAVVAFSMVRIAVRTLLNLGAVINNSLRPEFSLLIGAGRKKEAVHFLKRIWLLACVAGLLGYLALVLLGPSVLKVWSSGEVHGSHMLFAVVGIHALLGLIWYVPMSLDMSENRHTRPSTVYLLSAIATMTLWVAYRADLDPLLGASILLATPEFVMCLMVARYCKRSLVQA